MKDMADMMRQAQEMQSKIQAAQEKMNDIEATGAAGAGLVSVTLTGNEGVMKAITIDPSLLADEVEVLEDLIKAAYAKARQNLSTAMEKEMAEATKSFGGMMPGFKMPF